jgi:hypothetical protein
MAGLGRAWPSLAELGPVIHALRFGNFKRRKDVDARDIGERSDAIFRTAMRGQDVSRGLRI